MRIDPRRGNQLRPSRTESDFSTAFSGATNYIYGTYLPASDPTVIALAGKGVIIPVVATAQAPATIQGVDFTATGAAADWLTLKASGNLVRGYNNAYSDASLRNHNLPHVPADNLKLGTEIHERRLWDLQNPYFGVDAKITRAQLRTGSEDRSTPAYTLWGLRAGTEILVMNNRMALDAGVDNLFNAGYIDYNSLVKFANIQNPGRNVYLKVSVPFGS